MSTSDPDRFDWDRYEHEVGSTGQPAAAGQPDTDPGASGAGRVLVDSPEAQRPARGSLREATRRPIVPSWARSRQELAGRTRWAAGLATHYGAYHATRSPKYAGRLVLRAPRGAGRVLGGWVRWLLDLEGELGAPSDRPRLLDTAVVTAQAPRLTSDMVSRALSVLGVAGINQALAKDPRGAITFPSPITRDGPGWRADVDLPPGVTVGDVVDRRDRLASGLRRPLGCVWPEGDPGAHEGRLILWVGDRDLSKAGRCAGSWHAPAPTTCSPRSPSAPTPAADQWRCRLYRTTS